MHNSSSDFVFQGQTASILSYSISQFPYKKEVSAQMACFYAQASRYFVDLLKNDFDSLGRLLKWWRCIFTRDHEKHRTSFLKSGAFWVDQTVREPVHQHVYHHHRNTHCLHDRKPVRIGLCREDDLRGRSGWFCRAIRFFSFKLQFFQWFKRI